MAKLIDNLIAAAALIAFAACCSLFVLSLEKNAPQVPASAGQRSTPPPSAVSEPAALLSIPLPYTATITQYGDGISQPRTRFYVPKEKK